MSLNRFKELASEFGLMHGMAKLLDESNRGALKVGAENGWVIPLSMPYPVYKEIMQEPGITSDDLDQVFSEYYLNDFQGNVELHIHEMGDRVNEYLQGLLTEALWAFSQKKYQICVPALFSVAEGILTELSNPDSRSSTQYSGGLEGKINSGEVTVGVLPLISLSYFLVTTFKVEGFNQEEFLSLNRHWAAHGRYRDRMCETDVLKLFGFVVLLLFTFEFIADDVTVDS